MLDMLSIPAFCIIILVQDDSEGKVNILGGDTISHCKEECSYEHVSNYERLPR
jgi:hypothetical protein